jgi:GAF domain-containing protein
MNRHEFNRQLAEAARAMSEEPGTQLTLDRAVQMATDLIDHCEMAGLSVVRGGVIETPAASDETLRRVDEVQYEMQEGPCLQALHQTDVVTASNLAEDDRFPKWGRYVARELDLHSSMSFRLFTDGESLGALNLYSTQVNAWNHDDLLDGLIVAAHASIALAATLQEEHFKSALETRQIIGQAIGILRERFDLSADQAFGLMRRVSSTNNLKINQIARQLVDTGRLPDRPRKPSKTISEGHRGGGGAAAQALDG